MRVGSKQLVTVNIPTHSNAKCELIAFLDSVDSWLPGKIRECI